DLVLGRVHPVDHERHVVQGVRAGHGGDARHRVAARRVHALRRRHLPRALREPGPPHRRPARSGASELLQRDPGEPERPPEHLRGRRTPVREVVDVGAGPIANRQLHRGRRASVPAGRAGLVSMTDFSEILQIVGLSILVSGTSTLIGSVVGVPVVVLVALRKFRGRNFVRTVAFTFYGFPPVLAGLLVFLILSRGGPLGFLGFLFTPIGMILAQSVIVMPIVMGITISAMMTVEKRLHDTSLALGANERQWRTTALHDARVGVFTAVMVGFGRAISEVGTVLIVGGNIRGQTRVLTTAIVLEISQAHYLEATIFGIILFVIAFAVFAFLQRLQAKGVV